MKKIDKNSYIGNIIYTVGFWVVYFFRRMKLLTECVCDLIKGLHLYLDRRIMAYPSTIQLPITYKCNFDCVMCGMHHLIQNKDFKAGELEKILEDRLFSKVKVVGINGGEPFLKDDLVECVEVMIDKLKNLKYINIISNGYFTDLIVTKLHLIYGLCSAADIKVHISFSVDGIEDMQDYMRGKVGAWKNVQRTLEALKEEKGKAYDSLGAICTITKYNIYRISQVENWARKNQIKVNYNIATVNQRIDNQALVEDFTLLNDTKASMLAREFFYKKAMLEHSKIYFGLFLFLRNGRRYSPCHCQTNQWVTLTPNGQISYCATHSKELGSALDRSAFNIFNDNIEYLHQIAEQYCNTCSHYISTLNIKGRILYYKELLRVSKIIF